MTALHVATTADTPEPNCTVHFEPTTLPARPHPDTLHLYSNRERGGQPGIANLDYIVPGGFLDDFHGRAIRASMGPNALDCGPWYYFNRLLVPRQHRGNQEGPALLQALTTWADQYGANIFNPATTGYMQDEEAEVPKLIRLFESFGFTTFRGALIEDLAFARLSAIHHFTPPPVGVPLSPALPDDWHAVAPGQPLQYNDR